MKNFYKYLTLSLLLAFISCYDYDSSSSSSTQAYQYHTPEEINIFLEEIHSHYPKITSIETVGSSQSGNHEIKALIITDNPVLGISEGEPAVRLTGGIHGDEMMGIELLIKFVEYITSNYGINSAVTKIVNSKYICIIPVLNPDGLAANTRYNSRGVDLNRNFDDAWGHWTADPPYNTHGASAFSEAESKALRDFSPAGKFDLSVTYHTGEVLVNLPFDFAQETFQKPAQYELIRSYATTYTKTGTFLSNPDIYNSTDMYEGIINGGNWYVITGSLQDWSYTKTQCLDLTIEVAIDNPVTEEGVQQVFTYNRDSLMAYITKAGDDTFDGL